jgi:hypothetical protein
MFFSIALIHSIRKPDNFLFENELFDSTLKVIDFGMSKHVERRKYHRALCGTRKFS